MPTAHGIATEAELARIRAKIGQVVTINEPPYLTEVTRDSVRHWAQATGDRNPLFIDEAYARASRHGSLLAPPCQLYAYSRISIGYRGGLPGVHSFFAGSHWRWHEPIKVGERINPEVTFTDLAELPSRFAGRMFKQISLIRYLNGDGRELAQADSWGMRVERVAAQEKGKYKKLELAQPYTRDQLEAIAKLYAQEQCRGRQTLYSDDVKVGDAIPQIIRGPYTATIAVAFEQAWGGLFIKAHGYWFDYLRRHPAAGIANAYNIPEPPEAVLSSFLWLWRPASTCCSCVPPWVPVFVLPESCDPCEPDCLLAPPLLREVPDLLVSALAPCLLPWSLKLPRGRCAG